MYSERTTLKKVLFPKVSLASVNVYRCYTLVIVDGSLQVLSWNNVSTTEKWMAAIDAIKQTIVKECVLQVLF